MCVYVGVVWAAAGRRKVKEREQLFQVEDATCAEALHLENLSMCNVQTERVRLVLREQGD